MLRGYNNSCSSIISASTKTPTIKIMSCLLYLFHDDDIVLLDEKLYANYCYQKLSE